MHSRFKKMGSDIDWGSLGSIRDDQELTQLVIEDLVYCQNKAIASAQALGLEMGQIDHYVFDGLFSHSHNLEKRLAFLHQLMDLPVSERLACPPN